jgi:ABC-type uncharacterized transport system fused permease/ATPase subunit
MSEGFNKSSNAAPSSLKSKVSPRLRPQIIMMFRALLASPQRNKISVLGVALAVIIGATAYGQIRLNAWNQPFYDALSRKDLAEFFAQLIVFCSIAVGLLILNVAKTWFSLKSNIILREGLVRDLFDQWLKPGRAFRLADAGDIGANPDQRIHEDARHLSELTSGLALGLLESSLLLVSFIGVLWMLSGNVIFHFGGRSFGIPGYMVWSAAGLWRWGIGRVTVPSEQRVMFMPRQPYVPLGTLRAALAYPSAQVSYKDEELAAALRSTGLDRLTSAIDQVERWDKELSFDEQQCLVFTRALLHRPHCVVIDEALDTLDDATQKCIFSLFKDELKETAIINIGRSKEKGHFFTRVLQLIKEPSGSCFVPDLSLHGFGQAES